MSFSVPGIANIQCKQLSGDQRYSLKNNIQVTRNEVIGTLSNDDDDGSEIKMSLKYEDELSYLGSKMQSHVIIIIINKQGQMISRMRVLIIQAK